jgi:hypothetical protein
LPWRASGEPVGTKHVPNRPVGYSGRIARQAVDTHRSPA